MTNLFVLLLMIFGGVALMVFFGERFAKPANPEKLARLQRWLLPLVGLMLVLSTLNYYL
ncbi:hypothetical protein [Parahalioglobus pacificus]|uniref:Uncharacterized protein n=1 Tax=Parahalioglobus pacificus TaxID=930806 RepID=A0A919CHJ8_9GAMM|nr:hypothetical protein [Halioglobus pacificus]NQY03096.1 hypothetical protein [Halieaceae bacterium]GHD26177.1 hypothetical protein GCM10007053_02800 [Halioglobus pacificus]